MKLLFLFITLLTANLPLLAQNPFEWQYSYGTTNGDEDGQCMIPINTGGYLMGGSQTDSTYQTSLYFVRTDANGNVLWEKRHLLNGFVFTSAASICEDADGNFMVAGSGTTDLNAMQYDAFLLKLNSQGDTLWNKSFRSSSADRFISIKVANDNNFIVSGMLEGKGVVAKFNSQGNSIWIKSFQGNTQGGTFDDIQPVANGYLAFQYAPLTHPFITLLLNENGDSLYSLPNYNRVYDSYYTSTGSVILASGRLVKMSTQGDTLWTKQYSSGSTRAVAETPEGNYIALAERYNLGFGDIDFVLILTDANGTMLKDTVLTRYSVSEYVRDIRIADNGDYILFGYTTDGLIGNNDFILARFKKWDALVGAPEALKDETAKLTIYPNPARDKIHVQLAERAESELQLYTLQGQQVLRQQVNGQQEVTIHLNNLAEGSYLLHYTGRSGAVQTQKIIKY